MRGVGPRLAVMAALLALPVAGQAQVAEKLTGTFYGTRVWGEYLSALQLPEEMTVDEPESVARVRETGPAAANAVATIALISWDTATPLGKRLERECPGKCRIDGTIELADPDSSDWRLASLSKAEALPDDFDFLTLSRFAGAAEHARLVRPHDVGVSDPLRRPLLDALRGEVERDFGQPVKFVVETLRTADGFAFAEVVPQTPAGKPIDHRKTRQAARLEAGVLDSDHVFALLQQQQGRWAVREWVVGPTDVPWADWPESYGAPREILPGL